MSLQSGIFPEKWKLSSVVPIPKGGDRSNPSNYRLISLYLLLAKCLSDMPIICLHLASDQPLANSQWGFQSGKVLLATTYDWFQELESGKGVCSVNLVNWILCSGGKRLYLGEMNPTPSLSYPVCLKDQSWDRCSSLSI